MSPQKICSHWWSNNRDFFFEFTYHYRANGAVMFRCLLFFSFSLHKFPKSASSSRDNHCVFVCFCVRFIFLSSVDDNYLKQYRKFGRYFFFIIFICFCFDSMIIYCIVFTRLLWSFHFKNGFLFLKRAANWLSQYIVYMYIKYTYGLSRHRQFIWCIFNTGTSKRSIAGLSACVYVRSLSLIQSNEYVWLRLLFYKMLLQHLVLFNLCKTEEVSIS